MVSLMIGMSQALMNDETFIILWDKLESDILINL